MNSFNFILLFANAYSYKKDGVTKEGLVVNYLSSDSMTPYEEPQRDGGIRRGYEIGDSFLPYEARVKIKEVPAVYNFKFRQRVNKSGNPELFVVDLDYVSPLKLASK